jgi:hypothetical protein
MRRGDVLIALPDTHIFSELERKQFLILKFPDSDAVLQGPYKKVVCAGGRGWIEWLFGWTGWTGTPEKEEQRFFDEDAKCGCSEDHQACQEGWCRRAAERGFVRVARFRVLYWNYLKVLNTKLDDLHDETVGLTLLNVFPNRWVKEVQDAR